MFNLMKGVTENEGNVTVENLLTTARACNNLAYCLTVVRIRDQHAQTDRLIRSLIDTVATRTPKSMMRHLRAKRSILVPVGLTAFKLRHGRRRVTIKTRHKSLLAVHAVTHFQYDASTTLFTNAARLQTVIQTLTGPVLQTNRTAPEPAILPASVAPR